MKTPYNDYGQAQRMKLDRTPRTVFELKDKRRYALRSFAELRNVNPNRKVLLVFSLTVYVGYTEGRVDADGDLLYKSEKNSLYAYGVPASFLTGWAYEDENM